MYKQMMTPTEIHHIGASAAIESIPILSTVLRKTYAMSANILRLN